MVNRVVIDHDGHIATGIFGTKYLLDCLTETGHADVAYSVVTQDTFPGWGHMLAAGATMRQMSMHPRLGKLLVTAGRTPEAALACALLSERSSAIGSSAGSG